MRVNFIVGLIAGSLTVMGQLYLGSVQSSYISLSESDLGEGKPDNLSVNFLSGYFSSATNYCMRKVSKNVISPLELCRAYCYNSIENSLHFRTNSRKLKPFSYRFQEYRLGEIIPLTHDVALFRFLLPDSEACFNLPPCSTLQACVKHGMQAAEKCYRFYTPVTPNKTKGYFDIIVKRKRDGRMTDHLFGLHVGDRMLFRSIDLKIKYTPNKWSRIGMIAGGTGFTPMLQVIHESLLGSNNGIDKTQLSFLFCNRTERDILLKGYFDHLSQVYNDRFKIYYVIDQSINHSKWNGFLGYVTEEILKTTMPKPDAPDTIILICGPDHLLHHVAGTPMATMDALSGSLHIQPVAADLANITQLGGILGRLGYDSNKVYRF